MNKLFKNLLLALVAGFALVGCGPKEPTVKGNLYQDVVISAEDLDSIGAGKSIYVTSLGQGDWSYGKSLVEDSECNLPEGNINDVLEAKDVADDSVVVIVVGFQGKGLQELGLTEAGENKRTADFAAGAKAGKFKVIVLFVGGQPRRGEKTDAILKQILPAAEVAIVMHDPANASGGGNYDGKLPTLSGGTPVYCYYSDDDMVDSLAFMLK